MAPMKAFAHAAFDSADYVLCSSFADLDHLRAFSIELDIHLEFLAHANWLDQRQAQLCWESITTSFTN